MLGHTKKHRTEEYNYSHMSNKKNEVSERSIDWKIAAREALGDIPSTALNLQGLRYREGLTQGQLGQAIGVDQSNISKMESGKRRIGVKIAMRLEEIFDIDYRLFL